MNFQMKVYILMIMLNNMEDYFKNTLESSSIFKDSISIAKSVFKNNIQSKFIIQEKKEWIAPTLENSWVTYNTTWVKEGYIKDDFGFVHLRGLIKSGTTGTAIFNLPVGYRPEFQELFAVSTGTGLGRIDIYPNGDVKMQSGGNSYLQLSGIIFKAI